MTLIQTFKQKIKTYRDRLYSVNLPGKEELGIEDMWSIITTGLKSPVVYSGGVGKNISFELELLNRFQAYVFAFDPSKTGINTMKKILPKDRLHFLPVALANYDGTMKLYKPVNPEEGSYTKQVHKEEAKVLEEFSCRKVSSLMNELGHSRIDIIKLDIEGSEYDVIHNMLDEKIDFDQLCVEFHHFFDGVPKKMTDDVMRRLRESGYQRVHKQDLNYLFCKREMTLN